MAGSIFGIGTSGLLAAQRQLATVSHNISNVNTEGYTRQRAEQEARPPQFSGSGYVGTGVSVDTTVRLANEFLEEQIRRSNSQFGQYDAFFAFSSQIDNILANPDSGLTPTIESFFNALQEANDNPSSTPARQVLLTEANTMTERFKLLDDRFIQLNDQVNQQLVNLTQEISDAARSVAQLNIDIVQRIGAGQGNLPNDLLDQREVLIKKIAENIDVSVIYQDDGAANLFIGSGQSLVIGGIASTISTAENAFNAQDLDIILTQGAGSVNISNAITGGELQGVLDFKSSALESTRNALGRIAIAITEEMNTQHRLGMTLQDTGVTGFKLGGDFFTDLSGPHESMAALNNTGTSNILFEIIDSTVLTTSNYNLDYNGANYTLTKLDDPAVSYTAASLAALNTAVSAIEGFELSTSIGIIAGGDSFLIRPTSDAAANIGVEVNNVLEIALAAPVVSGAVMGADGSAINSGTGAISSPSIINISEPPPAPVLAADMTLQFNGVNAFIVTNGPVASIAYDPAIDSGGKSFTFTDLATYGEITFTITGVPDNTDSFVISNNTAPYDDNRNGLLMSKLQTVKTLENGSTDFQAAYAMIVSDVGTKTHSAQIDLLAQQSLAEQAKAVRESYSGVNLDEEAADLLKYQQAYQASAKVISTADEMFQTLIAAVG